MIIIGIGGLSMFGALLYFLFGILTPGDWLYFCLLLIGLAVEIALIAFVGTMIGNAIRKHSLDSGRKPLYDRLQDLKHYILNHY